MPSPAAETVIAASNAWTWVPPFAQSEPILGRAGFEWYGEERAHRLAVG